MAEFAWLQVLANILASVLEAAQTPHFSLETSVVADIVR